MMNATRDVLVIAVTHLEWISALSRGQWIGLLAACVLVWAVIRSVWGPSLVRQRAGLLVLRMITVGVLIAILLGPTIVDEQSGESTRPSMLYLFDGSQSMQLGGKQNRWEESLVFAEKASEDAGESASGNVIAYRFGHRLAPLIDSSQSDTAEGDIQAPDASDSRLADALRQMLPQVDEKSTAGVVLFSDGRVRASESVERLAEIFESSNVPIHVVPVGQAGGTGDIAIVSLVVPPRVRKYTENELQVFLRSFGYTGQSTTVRLRRRGSDPDDESGTLATLPITLTGGAQSASLRFRVDARPEDLVVQVDPIAGELTDRNNNVETRIEIDRTKVRVLAVENGQTSNVQSLLSRFLPSSSSAGAVTGDITIQTALEADEDIECTTLVDLGNGSLRKRSANGGYESGGFPRTRAELFAYDCLVFSDVTPGSLEEEQQSWLSQWIDGRGGGLIVTGASALQGKGWTDSPLEPLLPVVLNGQSVGFPVPTAVTATQQEHPIWRMRIEQAMNRSLIQQLPELLVSSTPLNAKRSGVVLAASSEGDAPVIVAGRAGRGRVLVSSAALGGRPLQQMAEGWGPQPERVAAKFWRNMVYWATEESSTGRRRLVAVSDKRFYRPGQQIGITATAYDEAAKRSQQYRVWAMFEPESLDDLSLYSPVLWPEGVVRESGEVGPRIAWGEELPLRKNPETNGYELDLTLSETTGAGDSGMRIEMTAYEGAESDAFYGHGTQVDSTSLAIQILSDPFEQQNPLPNHELLNRVAALSGGDVIESPSELSRLLGERKEILGPPKVDSTPAWSRFWLWMALIGLLSSEWVWRRATGLA